MSEHTTPTTTPAAPPPLHPNTSPSTSANSSSKGIDIQQALSILSARGGHGHDHGHEHDHHHSNSGTATKATGNKACGCHGDPIPDNVDGMGQTINLLGSSSKNDKEEGKAATEANADELELQRQQLEEQRKQRKIQIQQELDTMSIKELLQHVMKTQQDRVAAYREYERGLQTVLQTGNMTTYPETCAKATATFSVLSDTIKMVQETLDEKETRKRPDLAKLLKQLQSHEKEKLHLAAAHHLERIRQRNNEIQCQTDNSKDEGSFSSQDRISHLLREGVASLQLKINTCVESINEVLDEIRCAILDEED